MRAFATFLVSFIATVAITTTLGLSKVVYAAEGSTSSSTSTATPTPPDTSKLFVDALADLVEKGELDEEGAAEKLAEMDEGELAAVSEELLSRVAADPNNEQLLEAALKVFDGNEKAKEAFNQKLSEMVAAAPNGKSLFGEKTTNEDGLENIGKTLDKIATKKDAPQLGGKGLSELQGFRQQQAAIKAQKEAESKKLAAAATKVERERGTQKDLDNRFDVLEKTIAAREARLLAELRRSGLSGQDLEDAVDKVKTLAAAEREDLLKMEEELQTILRDPNASAEAKQNAQALLAKVQGRLLQDTNDPLNLDGNAQANKGGGGGGGGGSGGGGGGESEGGASAGGASAGGACRRREFRTRQRSL